jgi:hypothetical protein
VPLASLLLLLLLLLSGKKHSQRSPGRQKGSCGPVVLEAVPEDCSIPGGIIHAMALENMFIFGIPPPPPPPPQPAVPKSALKAPAAADLVELLD